MNNCCPKCFGESYDSEGEDYRGAMPEYCTSPSCECHKKNCELCQFEPENGHALNCIRHPDFSKQEKPEWEKELVEAITTDKFSTGYMGEADINTKKLIKFIKKVVLLSEKKRWVGEIQKLKKAEYFSERGFHELTGYNHAIKDILNILSQEIEGM